MRDTLIKTLFHRVLTHNMVEGHCHMTLTVQWRTICEAKQPVQTTKHRVHKHLPPIQMLLIIKFSFKTPRDVYPVQLVPLANMTTDIHSPPTRDRVRRLPVILLYSLLFQIYSHKPVHTCRAETWAQVVQSCSAWPCGEYDHWRKDCPYDCHCDNCDSDSHATHMCRAPPKPSPTPSPQPAICIYCGSSDHRLRECRNRPWDNREEGRCTQSSIQWILQRHTM